jgi:predicted nucleotidyltransferase
MIKKNHDPVLKDLSETLKKGIEDHIKEIILFGSRARGDSSPESDYDLLVLVDKEIKEVEDRIFNITCEIGWKHNVVITAFVHEKDTYKARKYEPLFMNIRKEGVRV